jgi:hypothetical protein
MSILHAGFGSSGGYQISNSVRLRAAASAYLSRTPAAGNRKTWTLSLWVKRSAMANGQLFAAYVDGTNYTYAAFESDALRWSDTDAGANTTYLVTTQLFRDPSAWYHLLFVQDTSTASGQTADNRRRIYVNGAQVTSFSSRTNPAADYEGHWNKAVLHKLGVGIATYFDGYFAKNEAIEGFKTGTTTANASDFGETNSDDVWVPKAYTGTYGTNGFHLDFKDAALTAGSNVGLGKDVSGNGNYWTTNNISVTAGVTYDSMVDTPTNNYATLNPLLYMGTGSTKADGKLRFVGGGTGGPPYNYSIHGTMVQSVGKHYWETTVTTVGQAFVGMWDTSVAFNGGSASGGAGPVTYGYDGKYHNQTAGVTFGATYTSGDVIGVAVDFDNNLIWFSKNGTWQNSGDPAAGTNGKSFGSGKSWGCGLLESGSSASPSTFNQNFGQRPFTYTPPTGFKALCTANLQPPVAPTASGSFTGNAAADGPFVWIGGVPTTLTINSNAVTFGTHADKTAGGFKLRTASASYNNTGSNTWSATFASPSTKSAFAVPQTAQGNP